MSKSHVWFVAVAAALVALWAPWPAAAASTPSSSQSCGITWKQTLYWAKSPNAFEIRVGIPSDKHQAIAQIWSRAQGCQAICQTRNFEQNAQLQPVLLELDCQAPGPVPLTTPATLFWSEKASDAPILRFGTWLGGYTQTRLQVLQDSYSIRNARPQLTPRKLAKAD